MNFKKGNTVFPIQETKVFAYTIPTEETESDGTLKWNHTILILVQLKSADMYGIGYTYANTATAYMIKQLLFPLLKKEDVLDNTALWYKMINQIRNLGRPGIASMAIAAVDNALWDLKAKLLNLPLCKLLGQVHQDMQVYASGGFTSYDADELSTRFRKLKEVGHKMFKMKIGRNKSDDFKRLEAARETIGSAQLFVDANGAYFPKDALQMAEEMKDFNISWFEEPVTSDDLEGMRFVRENVSHKTLVAAGEYGYDLTYFKRMLSEKAVDVLQADATRCAGITGFIKVNSLCEAFHIPLSAHCAPALHLHPSLAMQQIIHLEYFQDHVHIENLLFEGAPVAKNGKIAPDLSKNGMGLDFKFKDAEKYKINL